MTESGHSVLTAYAFSLPRGQFSFPLDPVHGLYQNNGQNYIQIQFRRRLGLEAIRLGYLPQTSMDLLTWRHNPADWTETSRVNPYDGSGTEIVTMRRTAPMTESREFARLQVGQQ